MDTLRTNMNGFRFVKIPSRCEPATHSQSPEIKFKRAYIIESTARQSTYEFSFETMTLSFIPILYSSVSSSW